MGTNNLLNGRPEGGFRRAAAVLLSFSLALAGCDDGSGNTDFGNTNPVMTVTIDGTLKVSRLLTSTAKDASGTAVTDATFQWKRSGSEGGEYAYIDNATSATYMLVAADQGKYLKVEAQNAAAEEPVLSAAKGPVEGGDDPTAPGQSATPAVSDASMTKISTDQTPVTFTLTTAPEGNWAVYNDAEADTHPDGVSVSVSGTTMSLSKEGGVPHGNYWVTVKENGKTESARLVLTVLLNAAAPVITGQPESAACEVGATALSVKADVSDGGVLSYQWYKNTSDSNTGGEAVGTDSSTYALTVPEIAYYYVVVTNTNSSVNGVKTATATSDAAEARVSVGVDGLESYLGTLAAGTATAPNTVILSPATTIDTSDSSASGVWATINSVTKTAGKYVSLDLSACTANDGDTPNSISSHNGGGNPNDMCIISGNEYIKGIVLPDTLTGIGESAFSGCAGLTSVTIPDSVTGIGGNAFYGCAGLTSVTIPDSVTGIGGNAFYGCAGLTSLTIPSGVTAIGDNAFYGCAGLASVTIPGSVTAIGDSAFYGCTGLASLTIPVSLVPATADYTSGFGKKVSGYAGLAVTLTGGGAIADYAFYGCGSLTSVTIGGGVNSIGTCAFYGCGSLTSVSMGGVNSIGGSAFMSCGSLTSVTIPGGVNSIGGSAFMSCGSLTSVTFDGSNTVITGGSSSTFPDGSSLLTAGNATTNTGYRMAPGTYTRNGNTWTRQ